MIQTKYTFIHEEEKLALPEGVNAFTLQISYPINYTNNIIVSCKQKVRLSIVSDKEQHYVKHINLRVIHNDFTFTNGSYAMQSIIKRIRFLYNRLELTVSYTGKIIRIHNIKEIQEQWSEIKESITMQFKGNQVERLVTKMDSTLSSEELLTKDISLYQNFGILLKPMYQQQYTTDTTVKIPQILNTRYGKIMVKEKVLLQPSRDKEDIQLAIESSHPENEKYVTINGVYNFNKRRSLWLQNAAICIIEKYGRQEYQSIVNLIKN